MKNTNYFESFENENAESEFGSLVEFDEMMEPTEDELEEIEFEFETENGKMENFADNDIEDEIFDEEASKIDGYYYEDMLDTIIHQFCKYPVLSSEEEAKLFKTYFEGSDAESEMAREQILNCNYRLVFSMAKRYVGRGVALEDIFMQGVSGLMKAVDKFDLSLGHKFSTYACWWIKQAICRGINEEGSAIRIPVHKREDINKVKRAVRELSKTCPDEPSVEAICEFTKLPKDKVEEALVLGRQKTVSFDSTVGEDGDSTLEDFLEDKNAIAPESLVLDADIKESIMTVVSKLPEKEAKVITLRFGLDGSEPMTLEKISELPEFGVTRERVRQIEDRALKNIRRNVVSMNLLKNYAS